MYKRINGKLVKVGQLVVKDGHHLAVLRPLTEEAAAEAIAKACALADSGSDDTAAFNAILSDQERMIFVGLLGESGRILDPETQEIIEKVRPGDSFIKSEDLAVYSVTTPADA